MTEKKKALRAFEGAPVGRYALPGAVIPFNLVLAAPANTPVKDLVYSVVLYNERGDLKSTDFRVSLKTPVQQLYQIRSLASRLECARKNEFCYRPHGRTPNMSLKLAIGMTCHKLD